ncbi:hypothetical protein NDU88_003177, partial [Pleurodeles waltl]
HRCKAPNWQGGSHALVPAEVRWHHPSRKVRCSQMYALVNKVLPI